MRRIYTNMKAQTQTNPDYYKRDGIEVIDFIDAFGLNLNLGNVIKYVARAGNKTCEDTLTDLSKAEWYLHREIKKLMLLQC